MYILSDNVGGILSPICYFFTLHDLKSFLLKCGFLEKDLRRFDENFPQINHLDKHFHIHYVPYHSDLDFEHLIWVYNNIKSY